MELEIDCGGESSAKARQLLDLANAEEALIYIKRDGSLDDGWEIVTHPMSLDFHRTRMPWAALMRKAAEGPLDIQSIGRLLEERDRLYRYQLGDGFGEHIVGPDGTIREGGEPR